jgi:hypothetical protein
MISTDEKTEKKYVVACKRDSHAKFVILVYDKNQREYFWVWQRDISNFLKEDNCPYKFSFKSVDEARNFFNQSCIALVDKYDIVPLSLILEGNEYDYTIVRRKNTGLYQIVNKYGREIAFGDADRIFALLSALPGKYAFYDERTGWRSR